MFDSPISADAPVLSERFGSGLKRQIKTLVIGTKINSAGTKRLIRLSIKPVTKSMKLLDCLPASDDVIT
jgi:hypothetical protein